MGFVIFADKTKLLSFGTEKGYPVFTRLANLAAPIWNSRGYGGGWLVGWLLRIGHEHGSGTSNSLEPSVALSCAGVDRNFLSQVNNSLVQVFILSGKFSIHKWTSRLSEIG